MVNKGPEKRLTPLLPLPSSVQGVVQRAYNAFAVRVQFTSANSAGNRGGEQVTAAAAAAAGVVRRKVMPAEETTEGLLCIEMRIRLYHDGAMSQLLEKLAHVSGRRGCGGQGRVEGKGGLSSYRPRPLRLVGGPCFALRVCQAVR